MQRKTRFLLSALCLGLVFDVATTPSASAFWGYESAGCAECGGDVSGCKHRGRSHEVYHYLESGRQANAMWPYPYVCPDRVWAHAPFDAMVVNGWRRQNLLGSHHFDPAAERLTRAGELKVQWILTQTPPERRQIFIERSLDSNVTDQRIAAAQDFANGVVLDGSEALVQDTHIQSEGRPASMVDSERSSFIDSRPPAVLPTGSTSTAASSN